MAANSSSKTILLFIFLSLVLHLTQSKVTYDKKALIINGHRRILFSGSIHYPRSSPEVCIKCISLQYSLIYPLYIFVNEMCFMVMQMWEKLIQKAKDGGLDVIDTYVFWSGHEPSPCNVVLHCCLLI